MNDAWNTGDGAESDTLVSNAYRHSATEVVPARLDQTVLDEASRAIGNGTFTPRFPGWFSPAVVAATVVIGLTFYLEYESMRFSAETAGFSTEIPKGLRATPDETANELATAVKSTGRKLRALDSSSESLQSGNKPAAVGGPDSGATVRPSLVPPGATRFCSGEMSASEESWRSCIAGLQREGFAEAARIELGLLKTAYPDPDPGRKQ
jgi:hypothetical protein